jgi:hypothetical protein
MPIELDLVPSPSLCGQWIDGQLYIVDVNSCRFYLLPASVGLFLSILNQPASAVVRKRSSEIMSQLNESIVPRLYQEGILVERSKLCSGSAAEIEAIDPNQVNLEYADTAWIETGEIEMRLVASEGGGPTTTIFMEGP